MPINVGDDPGGVRPHMLSPDQFAFTPPFSNSTGHTPQAVAAVTEGLGRWSRTGLDAQGLHEKSGKPMSELARMASAKPKHFDAHVGAITGMLRD